MAGDADYASVSLLLHCDGTDGSTSFPDSGPLAHTVTAHGAAEVSTADFKYGTAAALCQSAGWLTVPNHAAFDFGSGDFTIETWVRLSFTAGNNTLIGKDDGNPAGPFRIYRIGTQIGFYSSSDGSSWDLINNQTFGSGFTTAAPYHLAVTRQGNTWRTFRNGVLMATSGSVSGTVFANTGSVFIGFSDDGSEDSPLDGWLDDIRITKGVARYTATFTPPDAALPDTPQFNASGFLATNFGTPALSVTQTGVADGFLATTFGAPRLYTPVDAAGFLPTTFGTPRVYPPNAAGWLVTRFGIATIPLVASGFLPTLFGTATGTSSNRATHLGPTVRFGTPTTPTDRDCDASAFLATQFGQPLALVYTAGPIDRIVFADGARNTHFGTPTAAATRTEAATGFLAFNAGTPTSAVTRNCQATGFAAGVVFGAPKAVQIGHASGVLAVHFGNPSTRRTQQASAIAPRTRFGTPSYTRGAATHFAYGINAAGRVGRPRSLCYFPHPASGFLATHMGTPSAHHIHRASAIAPATRFGTPLAVRNPRC